MPLTTLYDAPTLAPARSRARASRNFLLRIVDIADSNRREAERDIARIIARHGGQLTDRLERDIAQRFAPER